MIEQVEAGKIGQQIADEVWIIGLKIKIFFTESLLWGHMLQKP